MSINPLPPFKLEQTNKEADEDRAGEVLLEYWRHIWSRKWSILFLALIGAMFGIYKALSETPIYRSELTLLIENERSNLAAIGEGVINLPQRDFLPTQYQLIRSRKIAERVVDKLNLTEREPLLNPPKERRTLSILRFIEPLLYKAQTKISLNLPKVTNKTTETIPEPTDEQLASKKIRLARMIQGGLSLRTDDQTRIIQLSFASPDPVFATEVVNATAESYIEYSLESRADRASRTGSWLSEKLEELRTTLDDSEARLQEFREKEGLLNLRSAEALTESQLATLNAGVREAEAEYNELSKRYGPKHPRIVNARDKLAQMRRKLSEGSKDIVATGDTKFKLSQLEKEVASNQQLYDLFLERFQQGEIATDPKLSYARIVDPALLPRYPTTPNERRIIGLWATIGLALGIALSMLRGYLENTYKTPEQVESKLGIPVLGIVPLLRTKALKSKDKRQRVTLQNTLPERHYYSDQQSSFAESINSIRTGILYSNVDHPPKILLVSSSVQGEGKTTLSTNLALAFSTLGKTLVIDADLRKPRIGKIADTHTEAGLVDIVAGQASVDECVARDSAAEDLYILKSGGLPPNPLELLSSNRMKEVIADLGNRFDHLVIDTAPILPVSDAIVLSHIADALVLVIQSNHTTHNVTRDVMKRLKQADVNVLGGVLTQVDKSKMSYHYQPYEYYHAYYGPEKSKKITQPAPASAPTA